MKKKLVAIVLSGGAGNRFWPLSTNKIVFPFFGKSLIEHVLAASLPKEVSRVVMISSLNNDQQLKGLELSVPYMTVLQREPRGMADAILSAASELTGVSLLILNGDDVFSSELIRGVMATAQKTQASGVIPGWRPQKYFPGGYLKLSGEQVISIVEKPGAGREPSPYAVTLGHFIEDSDVFLHELRTTTSDQDDVYEKALTKLMTHGKFVMHPYEGEFASLKYPWHVLSVMDILLKSLSQHRGKNIDIKSNVVIEGPVYIDDGVRIFENSKITGPCYIGKNTIVGNNNIIRHSHLGSGCVTGFNTDITRSFIGDNCWFHSNYVGDSVIEGNVSLGSGTVLANLRLDEGEISSVVKNQREFTGKNKLGSVIGQGVRIGVNTSVMPGVKIGRNSLIGAGVVVLRDVPDHSFVAASTKEIVINKNRAELPASREEFRTRI